MSKIKQYDITPEGWVNVTRHQRREVLSLLFERFSDCEIRVTQRSILVLVETGRSMGVEALYRLLNSVAKSQPSEPDKELAALACGDSSCQLWPMSIPRGQCTNGGCRCFNSLPSEERTRWRMLVRLLKLQHNKEEI